MGIRQQNISAFADLRKSKQPFFAFVGLRKSKRPFLPLLVFEGVNSLCWCCAKVSEQAITNKRIEEILARAVAVVIT